MQYDLFCMRNRVVRTLLGFGLTLLGIAHFSDWWGVLVIAYAGYLITGVYSAANHTAHKLAEQIEKSGAQYPATRFRFQEAAVLLSDLNSGAAAKGELLRYQDIFCLGEDSAYFYLFRDRYGGYMIPKQQAEDCEEAFRGFLEERCGKRFRSSSAPLIRLLRRIMTEREKEKSGRSNGR